MSGLMVGLYRLIDSWYSPEKRVGCDVGDCEVDFICALEMLHLVQDPPRLFKELYRMMKLRGTLILDDGRRKREIAKAQISESKLWNISSENKDLLKCSPR